jgi:hypothetical protein
MALVKKLGGIKLSDVRIGDVYAHSKTGNLFYVYDAGESSQSPSGYYASVVDDGRNQSVVINNGVLRNASMKEKCKYWRELFLNLVAIIENETRFFS